MRSRLSILSGSTLLAISLSAVASGADKTYGAAPKNLNAYLERLVSFYSNTISGYDNEFLF
jgi:hypothetical protein